MPLLRAIALTLTLILTLKISVDMIASSEATARGTLAAPGTPPAGGADGGREDRSMHGGAGGAAMHTNSFAPLHTLM